MSAPTTSELQREVLHAEIAALKAFALRHQDDPAYAKAVSGTGGAALLAAIGKTDGECLALREGLSRFSRRFRELIAAEKPSHELLGKFAALGDALEPFFKPGAGSLSLDRLYAAEAVCADLVRSIGARAENRAGADIEVIMNRLEARLTEWLGLRSQLP